VASRRLILDEWVLHDLIGDNGPGHQLEAFRFIEKLVEECDHIARSQPSPWSAKAYSLMEYTDERRRGLSRFLHTRVILNPDKCQTVHAEKLVPLPADLRALFSDADKYLGDLYQTVHAEVIITTDEGVYRVGEQSGGRVQVRWRDEFLESYFR